jgi:acetyl-CoA carboxylase biotin carboxyl carrier protein
MTDSVDIDAALVRKLADLLDEMHLTEIEYAAGETRVRVARHAVPATHLVSASAGPAAAGPADPVPASEDLSKHPGAVRSPMVGTAYFAAQPGGPPFVKLGDAVTLGQTLIIIEAMKVMNQIRAPKAGTISRVMVEDGGPLEFGQIIMLID